MVGDEIIKLSANNSTHAHTLATLETCVMQEGRVNDKSAHIAVYFVYYLSTKLISRSTFDCCFWFHYEHFPQLRQWKLPVTSTTDLEGR